MKKCIHECKECEEIWECEFPYYSKFKFYRITVNNGYYCNSYCPSCQKEEREEIDELFDEMSETGYIKSFDEHLKT
jgi:hypothetical protein